MAEDSSHANIASIVSHLLSCPPNSCRELSAEQINDFYYFKHRLVASLHRLYTKVPDGTADDIIARLLKDVLAEFDGGGG